MDLSDLGFKCGIEIHQRLSTGKLFCKCYCDPNKEEPNETMRIARKLKATVGEMGKFDPAAAFEAAKGKNFVYIIDEKTSCAVEADEEPPHRMNAEALAVALTVSKLLNSKIVDDIFVMRKTVIDGSAVSGFQRTALIALDGKIQTSKGEIPIPMLALEEESSGIVEKTGIEGEITYRLDRQGIPLIEIATSPDLKDGQHAMETAEKIGQLLRSTGKVQRGLGSIRQDLNISITQGARVEIKGVQELKLIPKLIGNEIARQINLLKIREQLKERHVLLGEEHFHAKGVSHIFKNT
ncbi:MAG: Glu-tRNA(Gln) amidotransferase subunit GatE, partial [Candidatus Micrarchaeota archaeon]